MKLKATLLILFATFTSILYGQGLLQNGAEWTYTYYEFWSPFVDYNNQAITGDTIIENKPCKILSKRYRHCDARREVEYIYQEDKKLYYYDHPIARFRMLYDFGAEVGDTIEIEYWFGFDLNGEGDSIFYIRIDSIDLIEYDSIELKRFHVSYDFLFQEEVMFYESNYDQGVIIENIGSTKNLFYLNDNGICDGSYNSGIRCFNHPHLGLLQFGEINCDSTWLINGVNENLLLDGQVEVYPNPAKDILLLESTQTVNDASIKIFSMDGKLALILQRDVIANQSIGMDVSQLQPSIYRLAMYDATQLIYSINIIKQ